MNLIDVNKAFDTDEKCLAFLEQMRWPDGVRCVTCGADRISKITRKTASKNRRSNLYQCLEPSCKQQFTSTSGTIFNDSHLSLTKWFTAVALVINAKKGMSAMELGRNLGIIPLDNRVKKGRKTAWYLAHRIREAMAESEADRAIPLIGTVEADETYVGGRYDPRRKRDRYQKPGVMGLIERGGKVRTMQIPTASKAVLAGNVLKHTTPDTTVYTDESNAYKSVGKERKHEKVSHIKLEWVRGDVHTNTIENFWSLFKRSVVGSFHQLSIKHLQRYMNECEYKFNNRKNAEIFTLTLARMCGVKPLPYKQLTSTE
jgi:transposase-like protein